MIRRIYCSATMIRGSIIATLSLVLLCFPRLVEPWSGKTPTSNNFLELIQRTRNSCKENHGSELEQCKTIPLIGVHDALSATILQRSNAPALFVSGFGVSASRLGQPDAGILTRTEMEDTVKNIIAATNNNIPIIADGDTGYGGTANVRQTVLSMASTGATALSIEDQNFPKRCTYVAGKSVNVVNRQDAIARIETALAAQEEAFERTGNPLLIVARTDCRMALGVEEAIERCLAFQELGADIVYAENLQSKEEYIQLRRHLWNNNPEIPTILAQVQTGEKQQTAWNVGEIGEMGYELALFGVSALQAIVATLERVSRELLIATEECENGPTRGLVSNTPLASLELIKEIVGFSDLDRFEQDYSCT